MPGTEDCDSNARGWVRWMRTATYQGHMGYNDVFGKDIVDALKGVALKQSLIKTSQMNKRRSCAALLSVVAKFARSGKSTTQSLLALRHERVRQ